MEINIQGSNTKGLIIVAIITVIGTIGAALISNWDKFSSSNGPPIKVRPANVPPPQSSFIQNSFMECSGKCLRIYLPQEVGAYTDVEGHIACQKECDRRFGPP